MTDRPENILAKRKKKLVEAFDKEEKWEKLIKENPRALHDISLIFIEEKQNDNLEILFKRAKDDQKFNLYFHCVCNILHKKNKLPQKWFKQPFYPEFSEKEVEFWCRTAPAHLFIEKSLRFLDQALPSWRKNPDFTQNMVSIFCRTPFPVLRKFISSNPDFLPQFRAFEEKVNSKCIVIDQDNFPEYFALKEKQDLLKNLVPQLEKAPVSKRVL